MRVTSLGFRTDVMLRVAEGAQVTEHRDHLVIRTDGNPGYWWGNFLLLACVPEPGQADDWLARFAAEFPAAQHVTLGVDTADEVDLPADFGAAGLPAEWLTVLTATEVRQPPRPNAAAEIKPLVSDADWLQSVELSIRCTDQADSGEFLVRRAAARRRMTETGLGARPAPSGSTATAASPTPNASFPSSARLARSASPPAG
jgi:hypothetical protein